MIHDVCFSSNINLVLLNPFPGKPRKCMVPKVADCPDDMICHFYFNAKTRMCEKGAPGHGFQTLTECYDMCSGK